MENKDYYPLRVGKHSSCIVSDRIPTRNGLTSYSKSDLDYEYDQYGGFIIAESIPSGIAQALVDAYNEKYGCTSKDKPCTGGKMCCQSKISHHEWVEQENKLSENSFIKNLEMDSVTNDKSVFEQNKPTIEQQIHFMEVCLKNDHVATSNWEEEAQAIIKNLQAIKRWNETPAYHGKIDVEKCLDDLVTYAKNVMNGLAHNGEKIVPHYMDDDANDGQRLRDAIVNGEAALGMLQVFKEEREAGMAPREAPEWIKKHAHVTTRPLTPKDVAEAHHAGVNILNRKAMYEYIPQKERDQLVDQIKRDLFSVFEGRSHKLANTIIFAIEQMDHLKRKHGR